MADKQAEKSSPTTGGSSPEGYRVLARKYRPQSFDDLVGQEPMVQTLSNAFKTGRIAQAYMLTGVRGIGKTTTARILARALNFKTDAIDAPTIDMDGMGENCDAIMAGNHLDIIEMDAASHTGIDDIRDLIDSAQYKPVSARYKVYIIDEVHMLSRNAFNGLLKTLEEPPGHLKFIFATTEINKVPVTVLSRCQRFDLRRINAEKMATFLNGIAAKENAELEDSALSMITRASEGSARDALSLLDQAIAHSTGKVTGEEVRAMLGLADRGRIMDLFEQLMRGDVASALAELREQYDAGAEPQMVLNSLADFVHFVTRLKYVPQAAKSADVSPLEAERGLKFSETLSVRILGRAWQILLKGIEEVGASERPLAASDMVLVRLAHASSLPTPDEIIRTISTGENPRAGATPNQGNVSDGNPPQVTATANPSSPGETVASAPNTLTPTQTSPISTSTGNVTALNRVIETTPAPTPQPSEENSPATKQINRFDELIFMAEDKRDLQIKTLLRKNVSLVHFEDGRMEFNIAGNPPASFLQDLNARLLEWTGRRWVLVTSQKGGQPTLEEQERAEQQDRVDDARADPAINAILSRFPGAKIVDVRVREEETASVPVENANPDGLDDFFE